MSNQNQSLRQLWTFEYSAASVLEAAKERLEYRKQRFAYWKDYQDGVMAEIKESGLVINESAETFLKMSNYSNRGASVSIKPELQEKLTESVDKMNEHSKSLNEYGGWVSVLEKACFRIGNPPGPGPNLELTYQDWLFFFGGPKPGVEAETTPKQKG